MYIEKYIIIEFWALLLPPISPQTSKKLFSQYVFSQESKTFYYFKNQYFHLSRGYIFKYEVSYTEEEIKREEGSIVENEVPFNLLLCI